MSFLHILENMKCNTRHSWTHTLRRESVAEHSFRTACMALLLADEFPELDMAKVIKMCLIHDWGEAVTGDIPSFLKTGADEARELDAIHSLTAKLPGAQPMLDALYAEMEARETPMVNTASPAARRVLGRVKATGQMVRVNTAHQRSTSTAMAEASGVRLKSEHRGAAVKKRSTFSTPIAK